MMVSVSNLTLITKMEMADPSPIAEWWDALRIVWCDYYMCDYLLTAWSHDYPITLLHLPISKMAMSSSPGKRENKQTNEENKTIGIKIM
jgi:hypothetical protein